MEFLKVVMCSSGVLKVLFSISKLWESLESSENPQDSELLSELGLERMRGGSRTGGREGGGWI